MPALATQRLYFTVADLALRYAVNQERVLGWIAGGSLLAINVATNPAGQRPRWRISAEALEMFERARAATPAAPVQQRRAKQQRTQFAEFLP